MALINQRSTMMPKTGVYPGSGVAPGGQQGRSKLVHNGFGGTRSSNRAPGASQRRISKGGGLPNKPGVGINRPRPPKPPFPLIPRPQGNDHGPYRGPKPKPKETVDAPPKLSDFDKYKDSQYWLGLSELRNNLGLVQNPDGSIVHRGSQSRLAQLSQHIDPLTMRAVAPGTVGAKTLYDILYEQQRRSDARNIAMARSEAARRGVIRSGYNDRQLGDIGAQSAAAIDGLVRNYGSDVNDSRSAAYEAAQQQAAALAQYQQSQAEHAAAAAHRGYAEAIAKLTASIGGYGNAQ